MNKWSKYVIPNLDYGYYKTILNGIFNGTKLNGFLPCNKMTITNDYKLTDTFQAFKFLDVEGSKWDNNMEMQCKIVDSAYEIVFAWIIAFKPREEDEPRPLEAHLMVKMPEIVMEWPHYQTREKSKCTIGTYYVDISYNSSTRGFPSIRFWEKTEWIDGSDYYIKATHPHINNGQACWGNMKTNSYDPIKTGNIIGSLAAIKIFLNTYNKQSPYAPLETWQRESHMMRLTRPFIFDIGKSSIEVDRLIIPRTNGLSIDSKEMRAVELSGVRMNEGLDAQILLAEGFSLAQARPNYSMTFQEYQCIHHIPMANQLLPLTMRLVLEHNMGWMRAFLIAIKAAYYEWKSAMESAPKRWPQGVIKKSKYNELRAWASHPDQSKYYELPGFYMWQWSSDINNRLDRVPLEELHISDIRSFINEIDVIRGRASSFNLSGGNRGAALMSRTIEDKISDPDYVLGFKLYTEEEFAMPNKQNKKLTCRKLREHINAVDGLYQNAKYKQNKRFIEIITKEKEIIEREANNYSPIATKDKLPFESL